MLKETIMLPVGEVKIEVDIYGIESVTYAFAESRKVIVVVPGLTCKNWAHYVAVYSDLATVLTEHGFLCLVFASRGQHPSGGRWLHENAVKDLDTVVNFLRSQGAKPESLGLLGRSIGTSVALSYVAHKPHKVGSLGLWGTPYKKLYDSFFASIQAAKLLMGPRLTSIDDSFVFTEEMLPEHLLPDVRQPLLIGYGTSDHNSTFEEQAEAFNLSSSQISSFVTIKDAIHEMDARHPSFRLYAHTFANWFENTLTAAPTRLR